MTESGIWAKRAFEYAAAEYEQAQKDFGGELAQIRVKPSSELTD